MNRFVVDAPRAPCGVCHPRHALPVLRHGTSPVSTRQTRTPLKPQRISRTVLAAASAPVGFKAKRRPAFPFVKIADQQDLKLALLLNVVDSAIGGVLIMGDRGTGKSVAVRALVNLLPEIDVVVGDSFNSDAKDTNLMGPEVLQKFKSGEELQTNKVKTPLVELPLGATEDRICGTIDVEKALSEGIRAYEPGLLALANRGILYVDEVNLLDDALVDVVLDSAASGVNTVEREGVSIVHPAKFIMIGSGNPQEGELRPQLLDRFGLSINVATMMDREARVQMVLDRMAYEENPNAFVEACEQEEKDLRQKLDAARERLPSVTMDRDLKLKVSDICSRLDVDGLRGDLVVTRAARAFVALEGRTEVTVEDVGRVLSLALNHRLRKDPLDPIDTGTKVVRMFKMVTDPKFAAAQKKKKAAASGKKKEEAPKKAGAWGGLPG
ncbi:hypothetical protein BSKO_00346 [Bryopsis sp. KO-2023]|nr:hypothetical protein BSKO_00346 [Bryopsis sp. KO-2023]